MKELEELSIQLGRMGILNASLEVDFQRLKHYRKAVDSMMTERTTIIYDSKESGRSIPGFTVQINGVKMYFTDPKTVVEPA